MILGLDGFTWLHILISLAALGAGFVVLGGFLANCMLNRVNDFFIVTTVATSVSGFLFPFHNVLPSHVVGAISLVVLGIATYANYIARLADYWRPVYVIAAIAALYLNVFVLVAQIFLKTPSLLKLAPTQSELPFVATQLLVLLAFLFAGYEAYARTTRSGRTSAIGN